ncbi:hypothetical protein [Nocardia sp. NPDC060259]|uniref:hypothetical protein n=1 Tax=Nocardia sp. NPDC060259 TaxID=3347088 RepID=UPI00364A69B2
MRNHTGRMAIALGTLAAALALGSGVASAITITSDGVVGDPYGVTLTDGGAYSCVVLGPGFASGITSAAGTAGAGGFLWAGPVVGLCNNPVQPIVPGIAG